MGATHCPSCQAEIPVANARFCVACGRALAAAPPSAEEVTLDASAGGGVRAGRPPAGSGPAPPPRPAHETGPGLPELSSRYEIVRFLGEGGTKRVYLARDTRLDREVAIGLLKTGRLDPNARARLEREARAMASLGAHPHIVTLFDIEESADQIYIVCQYMDSGSLADRLAELAGSPLPLPDALRVGEQVARALEHAHGAGVVHRDVKPGNVWLRSDDNALLGDFGLALTSDRTRVTTEGTLLGTAGYIAPEQALGRNPAPASDLYSLGCLLYELVAGRRPFAGDDPVTVISQHLHADPTPPSFYRSELPAALDRLILELLAKQPEERPASAAQVAERLARLRAGGEGIEDEGLRSVAPATASRFVGRREEMARLQASFERTVRGHAELCLLVGEPGIGKTRLCEELRVYAALRGARVLSGPCYEGDSSIAYLPFAEAFRQYCRERRDDELRAVLGAAAPEIARLVSGIHERFPEVATPPELEGEVERRRFFDAVCDFLSAAAEREPLVLVIEDLHWADQPSLLLLRHLARRLGRAPVLLVGTYRDVDLDRTHPLAETLSALKREHSYERIQLRGFPRDDVRELMRSMGAEELPADFADEIWQSTAGNPFFVQEILRHLLEVGAVELHEGRFAGDLSALRSHLPEGIREVVGRRLSRLSDACNEVLARASLLPAGFSFELLAAICGEESEDALLDLLEEALRARILAERRDRGAYEFAHALVRQTLETELSTPRKVRLHARIGEAIERLHAADLDRVASELAHQFYQAAPAGHEAKAIAYSLRAAARAMSSVAYEEAAAHYRRARELLEPDDAASRSRWCECTLGLAEAAYRSTDLAQASALYLEASRRAEEWGLAEMTASAAERWSTRSWAPGAVDAVHLELVERALRMLDGAAPPGRRARLLAQKAQALAAGVDRVEERLSLCDEALRLARAESSPVAVFEALNALNLNGTPVPLDAEELARWLGALPDDAGLLPRYLLIRRLLMEGRAGEARRRHAEFHQIAIQTGDPRLLSFDLSMDVLRANLDGRFDEARAKLEMIRSTGIDARATALQVDLIEMELARQQGSLRELEQVVLRQHARGGLPVLRFVAAWAQAARGETAAARKVLDRAAPGDFAAVPHDVARQPALQLLGDCCVLLGDAERAHRLYELLSPWAGQAIVIGPNLVCTGAVDRTLGGLAATAGEAERAEAHFATALALEERLEARTWTPWTRVAWAGALLRAGSPDGVERARGLLAEARSSAEALGQRGVLDAIEVTGSSFPASGR